MGLLAGVNFPPPGTLEQRKEGKMELLKKNAAVLVGLLVVVIVFLMA